METNAVLDLLGELLAQLKGYASKLRAVVHLASVPSGIKPKPEAVEVFEQALSRFREQSGRSPFKGLQDYLIESLEHSKSATCWGLSSRSWPSSTK